MIRQMTTILVEEAVKLRSADQTALHVTRVRPPEGKRRARLAWVHGVAEYGDRYLETLRWLAGHGFDCAILDLRGHGRSEGRRVFLKRFSEYLDDMQAYFAWQAEEEPGLPLFALGHSMGGLVLIRTLQERLAALPPLSGAVPFSPYLELAAEIPAWKTGLAHLLSGLLPWFAMPTDLDPSLLSKDPLVGEAYMADPMVTKTATARWFTETLGETVEALSAASALSLPMLLMHGDDDGLAGLGGTQRFFAQLGSEDKELKLWPGARHELLNEVERADVREHLRGWLEARLAD
jgi:alpha-beta hydrolase superfamily lysophospholipase